MNQEIKKLWVDDLRSGEFEQGRNYLRRVAADGSEKFCCLAVLCEIAVKHQIIDPPVQETIAEDFVAYSYQKDANAENAMRYSVLPPTVRDWAGLNTVCGDYVLINAANHVLSDHNDHGCTFEEIAKAIEDQL